MNVLKYEFVERVMWLLIMVMYMGLGCLCCISQKYQVVIEDTYICTYQQAYDIQLYCITLTAQFVNISKRCQH